ncbi:glycoprotein precursor complex [Zerdali virus]|uniref:Envelopment polyprotein n=1 Tax=Zerdali virus TaxID=1764086 RepID=A0A159D817_9VIRU|nr:glycoprotein precursor complex [Zerdali virus]ALS88189.1 glycoprotein precursor complex [Zerdali virus]
MFYPSILILLTCFVQQAYLKFVIISEFANSTKSSICYSSKTELGQFLEAWENATNTLGLEEGLCKMGTLKSESCSKDLMSNYVSSVHSDLYGLAAMMFNRDQKVRIEVQNDRIPDSLRPGSHNCSLLEKKPFWTGLLDNPNNISTVVSPEPVVMSIFPQTDEDYAIKLKVVTDEMDKVQKALIEEKREREKLLSESRAKMRELEDRMRKEWEDERSQKATLSDRLDKERQMKAEAEMKAHELDKALKLKIRELEAERADRRESKPTTKRPIVMSTPAAIILTSILASSLSVTAELQNRDTNHMLNRPGRGAYWFSRDGFAVGQCAINYSQECNSWEHQLDPRAYPFFSSNYDKYSMLESAFEDPPIIGKEASNCILQYSSSGQRTCAKEAGVIKKHCSDDMRAFFFISQEAKLTIVGCQTGNILSEDCTSCITKSGSNNKIIYKPIQDVVCQKGGSDEIPPVRYSKDICAIGLMKIKSCRKGNSKFERMGFVVTATKKVYIEEMKMRSRQEYSSDQFLCYKIKKEATVKYEAYNVSMCKGFETPAVSDSKDCNGDEYYCGKYPCHVTNPEAHCMLRKHGAVIEVNIGGMWVKPKCVGYEKVLVKRTSLKVANATVRDCTTCLWECGKGEIVIKTHGPKVVYAIACSHGSCKSVMQDPSTFIHIPYPGNSEIVGGNIGIHMTEETSPSNIHLVVHCLPRDSCDISDCLFCVHGLLNYQCHTAYSALLVSTVVMALVSLIFYVLLKSRSVLKLLIPASLTPFCWLSVFIVWLARKWKERVKKAVKKTNNAIGWTSRREIEREPERAQYSSGAPGAKYSFYGTVILALVGSAYSCSESVIAESRIMQCNSQTEKTSCKATGTVVLKLGPIGSESCLLLKGLRDNEKQFISIRTDSSELVCREGESFWTSLYSPICLSSRRCHLMGECTGDLCLKWKSNKTSLEFTGKTHDDVIHENKCFEQSGGMGYGCFNVNPSCLYSHAYLKSVYRNGFKVFKCAAWNHRVRLTVNTHSRTFKITLMAMSTQPTDWGSIGLILDSEGITGSNSYSFMKLGSGSFAIVDEPYSMEPRKGFLGEVRCPTEEAAMKASSVCKVAPNLIEYQPEMDSIECITNMIDPMTIFNRGSLPQVRDKMTFTQSMEKSTVQAMTTGEIKASVRLVLDDYEVEYESNPFDCDATFKNLTGCYSCDEGARMCVQVKTGGNTIFHFSSEEEAINIMFKAYSTETIYCSILHFSKPVIMIEGQYDCGSSRKPMIVKGTLVAIAPHDDRSVEGGSSIVVNPKRGSVDLLGWLSGMSSWFGGPLKTFFIILGFLGIGLVLVVVVIMIIKCGLNQAVSKKMI